jgi:hypothetical protein
MVINLAKVIRKIFKNDLKVKVFIILRYKIKYEYTRPSLIRTRLNRTNRPIRRILHKILPHEKTIKKIKKKEEGGDQRRRE